MDITVPLQRIVLLGFMGTGKSAVGASLARRLEWDFIDFDREIEDREGRSINAVVRTEGEDYLRELERRLTEECRSRSSLVMAPGGGWILQTQLLDFIRQGTLAVWLQASPNEIVGRLRVPGEDRPLVSRPDAEGAIAGLLDERESLYRRADLAVPTDGRTVEGNAFEIEQIVRTRYPYVTIDRRSPGNG